MKRLLLFLLFCTTLAACHNDKIEYQTWVVASEKGAAGVLFGFGFVPANIVKVNPSGSWELHSDQIQGFTFEPGYESLIRVRIEPIAEPMADGSDRRYILEQLISRTPMQSVGLERINPEIELVVASKRGVYYEFPCYWIKDARYTDPRWEPLPLDIAGFDYLPGYEYRLRVKVTAERDSSNPTGYAIHFSLLEELDKAQTDSSGVPNEV